MITAQRIISRFDTLRLTSKTHSLSEPSVNQIFFSTLKIVLKLFLAERYKQFMVMSDNGKKPPNCFDSGPNTCRWPIWPHHMLLQRDRSPHFHRPYEQIIPCFKGAKSETRLLLLENGQSWPSWTTLLAKISGRAAPPKEEIAHTRGRRVGLASLAASSMGAA